MTREPRRGRGGGRERREREERDDDEASHEDHEDFRGLITFRLTPGVARKDLHQQHHDVLRARAGGGGDVMKLGAVLAFVGVVILLPSCAAFGANVDVATDAPVRLVGEWVVTGEEPVAHIAADPGEAGGGGVTRVVHGTLDINTWNRTIVGTTVQRSTDRPRVETVTLGAASVALLPGAQGTYLTLVGHPSATFALAAGSAGAGSPVWLASPAGTMGPSLDPLAPPRLAYSWPAGWAFCGDLRPLVPPEGFPSEAESLEVAGTFDVESDEGSVIIAPVDGAPFTVELGRIDRNPDPVPGMASVQEFRSIILHVAEGNATIEVGGTWGLGAPRIAWKVNGTAAWSHARGSVTRDGATTTFDDAQVTGEGELSVGLSGDAGRPARYAAEGDWSRLDVNGAAVLPPPRTFPTPPAAASAGVAALAVGLAAILGRGVLGRALGFAFYTRIAPARLLDHDVRARIHDLVAAQPGIHLRALQRELHTEWGTLSFHVAMLERSGILVMRRDGRYRALFLAGVTANPPAPLVRNATARHIYDAIPADGGPIALDELRGRVDVARQLLSYHLERLCEAGLVERDANAGSVRRR